MCVSGTDTLICSGLFFSHTNNSPPTPCISEYFFMLFTQYFLSGIEVFDTCGMREIAVRDVFFAVKNALEPRGKLPLLGKEVMVL